MGKLSLFMLAVVLMFGWAILIKSQESEALMVTIDIKPGSDSNIINPISNGIITVAIISTEDFDATKVDPSTVMFGSGGATIAHKTGHIDVDTDGDDATKLDPSTATSGPDDANMAHKVAVISTEDFDATKVDPSTSGPDDANMAHKTGHIDVDTDGDMDIVLHFKTQDTGIKPGDTQACLIGETYDGKSIKGCDEITVLDKSKPPKKPKKSQEPDNPDKSVSQNKKKAPNTQTYSKISIAWGGIKTRY